MKDVPILAQCPDWRITPGLDVCLRLAEALGEPHRQYPIVHVAGTNGKGSVCALLASILAQGGRKVGLYTSPHLVDINERIVVAERPISDARLLAISERVDRVGADLAVREKVRRATYFEALTTYAFLHFAEEEVDVAVVETGMGGRWDATNIVTPAVSVITTIGLDHTQFLGSTLAAIAREKAGIAKPGVSVVCGDLPQEALQVIAVHAGTLGAPIVLARDVCEVTSRGVVGSRQAVEVTLRGKSISTETSLLGRYQLQNIQTAVAAVDVVSHDATGGLDVVPEELRRGIARASWPGRLHVLREAPLVFLDGAHNPAGAFALGQALREYYGPEQRIGLVLGMCDDKEIEQFVNTLGLRPAAAWTVELQHPRRASHYRLTRALEGAGYCARPARSLVDALSASTRWAEDQNAIVLLTGSLYLAGEVLEYFR